VPEPVADVARAHADVPPAAAAARAAWRQVLLDWAGALPATVPLRELDETLPAVLGALRSALDDGAVAQVPQLLLALAPAWAERSLPAGGLQALRQALADEGVDGELAARAQALAAQLCAAAGRRAEALAHADAAARRWPADAAARAAAQVQVARVHWRCSGDAAAAAALLDEAEAAAGADPAVPRSVLAAALTLRATLANEHARDPAQAATLYRRALAAHEADPQGSAHARRGLRYNLAITDIYAGRAAAALPALDRLRDEAEAAHDRHLLAQVLNARGSALDALGRPAEALAATRAALAEAWATLETENALYALWNLAPLALARGDLPGAALAARLMGFAERFWRLNFGALSAADRRDAARTRRRCRQALGRAAGQRCWDEGAALDLAQAVALARA
jgi:tetratricopeptide (TPR) repeat protein